MNRDSNRIHKRYLYSDLSAVAAVHTSKVRGVNFICSSVFMRSGIRNREQDCHLSCTTGVSGLFQAWAATGGIVLLTVCKY